MQYSALDTAAPEKHAESCIVVRIDIFENEQEVRHERIVQDEHATTTWYQKAGVTEESIGTRSSSREPLQAVCTLRSFNVVPGSGYGEPHAWSDDRNPHLKSLE